jgi:hypothetical protein
MAVTDLKYYNQLTGQWESVVAEQSTLSAAVKNGTQTIQGGETPAIVFPRIDGRTLINLLGDVGSAESTATWSLSNATMVVDTSTKTQGTSSLKVTLTVTGNSNNVYTTHATNAILPNSGKYILLADVKNGNATGGIKVSISDNVGYGPQSAPVTDSTKFSTALCKYDSAGTSAAGNRTINIHVNGDVGQFAYADALRVYRVSDAEYADLDTMTADQIAAKYPYVGTGIFGVQNPAVEVVKDNLIPAASEWGINNTPTSTSILDTYKAAATANGVFQGFRLLIPVLPNTQYSFTVDAAAGVAAPSRMNVDGSLGSDYIFASGGGSVSGGKITFSFTTDANATAVFITMTSGSTTSGTFTFSNPVLMPGTSATFKPQSKTTARIKTELLSTPDRSVTDEFKYVNGKPKRVGKLRIMPLDGSWNWSIMADMAGYKIVRMPISTVKPGGNYYPDLTKYDGKVLEKTTDKADAVWVDPANGVLYTGVADPNSGWGEAYTPTAAEIQAYFWGWKMYELNTTASASSTYTRTDGLNKAWTPIMGNYTVSTSTLPTSPPNGTGVGYGVWKSYQLQYQLAQPVIEDVAVTGAAVVERGDNYVTVTTDGAPISSADLTFASSLYTSVKDAERQLSILTRVVDRNDMRDLLYNSGAYCWERGTVFNNPAGVYTLDRNRIDNGVDNNVRVLQSKDVPNLLFPCSIRIEEFGAAGGAGAYSDVWQFIPPEDAAAWRGQVVTAGWLVKCDVGVTGAARLSDNGITPNITKSVTNTSWQIVTATKLMDEKTIKPSVSFRLSRDGLAVGGGMNVIPLGANLGYELRPFQHRKPGEVLAECQSFYERHDSLIVGRVQLGLATALSATSLALPITFKTKKRGTYTMTSGGGWRLIPGGTAVTLVMGEWSLSNTVINMTVSGATAGQSSLVQSADSGGWVAWDAEI